MLRARLLVFAAALLALALPGHPLALLSGLPLDLPSLWLLLLLVGWAILLPGAPPRPLALVVTLLALAALKVTAGGLAPAYGLDGSYRLDSATAPAPASWPSGSAVTQSLDFQGDTFPLHFVNDVRSLNFYTPNQPKRDLLPFSARWSGLLAVPEGGAVTLTLEANGLASLEVGSGSDAARVTIDQPGRVSSATVTANLAPGLAPIVVTYQRPDEAMPWLVVRHGPADGAGDPLGGRQLLRAGTTPALVARDAWLRPLALTLDGLLLAVLAGGFAGHLLATARAGRRTSPAAPRSTERASTFPRAGAVRRDGGVRALGERALLAGYFVVAAGAELLRHLHLVERAVILSGGNDWLAYEGFARDILANGPLLTEGRALGQGAPFYYQPLYIYWVALTHGLLGESLFAPLYANTVLGVLTGLGLYLLTRELFGRAAAVAALALFELYRLTVFAPTAGLLLSENLLLPILPLLLLALVRLAATGRLRLAAGAGLLFGLAGLARTTPLALLPPALLILTPAWRRIAVGRLAVGTSPLAIGWGGVAARLALVVAVCVMVVGLATLRNYVVSGRPVPITSSAGANLWETHRPSTKVDLSGIDRDPLYERLGLDRATREVAEFIRQDPAGYVGTLVPMFLFAVGVVGAVEGRWDVQPLLFGLWLVYLALTLLCRRARALPTWFLHAFIWSHLAQMTVFFSHQYGFRLILPMYVAMTPFAALGLAVVLGRLGRLLAPLGPRLPAGAPPLSGQTPPAVRASLLALAVVGGAAGLGAGGWRSHDAAREAFYGLNGDAALATRQATRPELLRQADAVYFAGDDSRSTDVAYLSGLAFPALRWFDGARGLVLPPPGQQALYVLPDRAAADVARRCLGDGASLGRERDPTTGAGLELLLATAAAGECTAPREPIGATFAEAAEPTARLIGLEGAASIEPGRPLDVLIHWEALDRPRNRARPFVRLIDSHGRRWGQAETAVYPSSSWRPGERAVGVARVELDPTLPPGAYRLEGGFSAGSGQARLTDDGPWGSAGLPAARGPVVRFVSRSTPLPPDALPLDRRLDAALGGATLLGVDLDRETARPGERLRVTLFWQAGAQRGPRAVSLSLRGPGGQIVHTWPDVPVSPDYPMTAWKPGEIVRDTQDLVLPIDLPAGSLELATGLPSELVPLGRLAVQEADRQLTEPEMRGRIGVELANGARLLGVDYRGRRVRAGDTAELTLIWQTGAPGIVGDYEVTVALRDEAGRVVAQQQGEPAGGKRPTSGWRHDEYVEDGWKLRLPRELPAGRARLAVSMVDPRTNQRIQALDGRTWVELPIEVGSE